MNLARYARLYGHFLRFSFSKALEFRVDFYFRVGMDVAYYAMNLAFFKIIFLHSKYLAGWTDGQVTIFVGAFIVVDAIHMTVFANNIFQIGDLINKGDLDYYLVRPVSTFFFVSFRDFAANSFLNLLIAIGVLIWALARYTGPLGWARVSVFLLLILNGALLHFLVAILFILPTFWTHSRRGLQPLFWQAARFMERPHGIFTSPMRWVLLTILPFSLMASVPAAVLFEPRPWLLVLGTAVVTVLFFGAVQWVWRKGLAVYASASS